MFSTISKINIICCFGR